MGKNNQNQTTMKNNKHLYENYWDNSVDDEDNREEIPNKRKAIAIGAIILVSVVLGALRLWNVFQRP